MAYTTLLHSDTTLARRDQLTDPYRLIRGSLVSLRYVIAEARPAVQLVFGLRAAASAGMLRHPSVVGCVGVFGWVLLATAAYAFNGVTDVTEDEANGSSRPIASGRLPVRVARHWCLALVVAGLLACALANPAEVIVALAALLLGWAYSAGPALKRGALSLTCVAATAAGLSYVAGAAATGAISARSLAVPLCVALWVGLCAASKDFSDVDGDRIAGRRTLPIVLGNVVAARVVAVLSVAGGALTIGIAMWTSSNFAPAAAVAIGSVPLALTALRLASNPDCRVRRRTYRVLMSTQYVANAMLLVTVP